VLIEELRDPEITVIYGVDTCEDTTRARERFDAAGRAYRYVQLDVDTAARDRLHAAGYLATPVVLTPGGSIAMEPSDAELDLLIGPSGRDGDRR
jgi:glutaredoxin